MTLFRFAGGRLHAADWNALAHIATLHSTDLQLAVCGHVEVKEFRRELLPAEMSESHGFIRNVANDQTHAVIASPMAGRLPGHQDVTDLPEQLDAALRSRAEDTAHCSPVLIGLDDGSGDVLGHRADLTAIAARGATAADSQWRIHAGGRDTGRAMDMADAVSVLADVTDSIMTSATALRRELTVEELYELVVVALVDNPLAYLSGSTPGSPSTTPVEGQVSSVPKVGWVDTSDGTVSLLAMVPHGRITARLAEFLGAIERPSTISADHVIGIHGLTEGMAEQVVRVLAPMGMIFDAESPWVTGSV